MADEYIRKADAIKQCGFGMTSLHIADNLRKMRPADVVQVRHGKWIRSGVEGHVICNKCGYEANYTIIERQDKTGKWVSKFGRDIKTNFCPNCGAKMDGERKE